MVESRIREASQARIQHEVVGNLFNAFCDLGILTSEAGIIETIPQELQEPIINTLSSHVTKEKPLFAFFAATSLGTNHQDAAKVGAVVDLLWALSLMYDDLADQDKERAGLPSAWVKYGTEKTFASANAGFAAVKKFVDNNFGVGSATKIEETVNVGLQSLKNHRDFDITTAPEEVIENYRQRALFHTAAPFILLNKAGYKTDKVFLAIENVNLAGQILNDLKDISPKFAWLREGFSDIRSGFITLPITLVLQKISPEDRETFLGLFGQKELLPSQKASLIEVLKNTTGIETSVEAASQLYHMSREQFNQSLPKDSVIHVNRWIDYKLEQLAEIF